MGGVDDAVDQPALHGQTQAEQGGCADQEGEVGIDAESGGQ